MQKLQSVQEMHKILSDFEIQIDHLILTRKIKQMLINEKKTTYLVDFAVPADHRVKIKNSEKGVKYLDLVRELRNCGTYW